MRDCTATLRPSGTSLGKGRLGSYPAYEPVCAVFEASVSSQKRSPVPVLGYIKASGETVLFGGDLSETVVALDGEDQLIVFADID